MPRQGIARCARDPLGRASKFKLPFGFFNFTFSTFRKQAYFGASVKLKIPLTRD